MECAFTDDQRRKGRTALILFQILNAVSFNLMSGNIIALFALKIGANTYFVGLLNSFISFSMVMMIVGKMLVPKFGLLSVFRTFWALRYISMLPAILSAFLFKYNVSLALFSLGTGVFLFSVSRGIGFTGFSPMMASVASENDRGGFFSLIQLIFHVCGLFIGIFIVLLLGKYTSVYIYTIFISVGIVTGVMASVPLFFFPKGTNLDEKSDLQEKLFVSFVSALKDLTQNFQRALKRIPFKNFIIVNCSIFFLFGMVDPFVIVFFKKLYGMSDSFIAFLVIIGSVGAVVNAYISKKYIDLIGSRITLFLFSSVYLVTVFLLFLAPHLSPCLLWTYASIIFFFGKLCYTGMSTSAMIYLFDVIEEEEHLNLSIMQQMSCGMAGFIGGNIGGLILQSFESHIHLPVHLIYRIYFSILILFFVWLTFQITKLHNVHGYAIKEFFRKILFINS